MLTPDEIRGIGTALNESRWIRASISRRDHAVAFGFEVLTLPEYGPEPEDRRRWLSMRPVGRVLGSLRRGRWEDETAPVEPFALDRLDKVLKRFGGQPVYGWEFVDRDDTYFPAWRSRLSFDEVLSPGAGRHVLSVFQEGPGDAPLHLDVKVWFDDLWISTAAGDQVALDEFIGGGERWWAALEAGDERVQGHGIRLADPDEAGGDLGD